MNKSIVRTVLMAAVLALMVGFAPTADASTRNTTGQKYAAQAAAEHEICHLEGANICPPEPFEIVWVCITISMPAGYECPDLNEKLVRPALGLKTSGDDGAQQAALPTGNCVGVNACNDFIAECIGAGGDYIPEHDHGETGQPNLGSCGPIQD